MIAHEINQLKTGPRDLRKFGLLVGGVFALLAAWCWWRNKPVFPFLLAGAVPLLVLGLVWPKSLKWVYLAWMSLGIGLGWIVSTVLLMVFYYLVLTPVAILARVVGKDFLNRRLDPGAGTYWIDRPRSAPQPRDHFEQQF